MGDDMVDGRMGGTELTRVLVGVEKRMIKKERGETTLTIAA